MGIWPLNCTMHVIPISNTLSAVAVEHVFLYLCHLMVSFLRATELAIGPRQLEIKLSWPIKCGIHPQALVHVDSLQTYTCMSLRIQYKHDPPHSAEFNPGFASSKLHSRSAWKLFSGNQHDWGYMKQIVYIWVTPSSKEDSVAGSYQHEDIYHHGDAFHLKSSLIVEATWRSIH